MSRPRLGSVYDGFEDEEPADTDAPAAAAAGDSFAFSAEQAYDNPEAGDTPMETRPSFELESNPNYGDVSAESDLASPAPVINEEAEEPAGLGEPMFMAAEYAAPNEIFVTAESAYQSVTQLVEGSPQPAHPAPPPAPTPAAPVAPAVSDSYEEVVREPSASASPPTAPSDEVEQAAVSRQDEYEEVNRGDGIDDDDLEARDRRGTAGSGPLPPIPSPLGRRESTQSNGSLPPIPGEQLDTSLDRSGSLPPIPEPAKPKDTAPSTSTTASHAQARVDSLPPPPLGASRQSAQSTLAVGTTAANQRPNGGQHSDATQLSTQPWFFGNRKEDAANSLTGGKPPGTFAIRDSSTHPGELVLSYVHPQGSIHNVRVKLLSGVHGGYVLASSPNPRPLPSVTALVAHYAENDVFADLPCRLRRPHGPAGGGSSQPGQPPRQKPDRLAATASVRSAPRPRHSAAPRPVSVAIGSDGKPITTRGSTAGAAAAAANPSAWYFGQTAKARCTGLIEAGGHGCFLVRDSSSAPGYVLMVNEHGKVGAYQIAPNKADLLVFAQRPYKNLADIVSRGRRAQFKNTQGAVLVMTNPPAGGELFRGTAPSHAPTGGKHGSSSAAARRAPREEYLHATDTVSPSDDWDEREDEGGDGGTAETLKESPAGVLYAVVNPPPADSNGAAAGGATGVVGDANDYQSVTSFVHGDAATEAAAGTVVEDWTSPAFACTHVIYICHCEADRAVACKLGEGLEMAAAEAGVSLGVFLDVVELAEVPTAKTRDLRYTAMHRSMAVVVVVSSNATKDIATTESVGALFFQCECLWAVRIASGASKESVDGSAACSRVVPFVVAQAPKENAEVSIALSTMQTRTDAEARGVALDALRTLRRLPTVVNVGSHAGVLEQSEGIQGLVSELMPAPEPPQRTAPPPVQPYAGTASLATVDLGCVLESDKFKLIDPGQTDSASKAVHLRLMGIDGGCDCGVLEVHDGKRIKRKKSTKQRGNSFPLAMLDLKGCLALDISNTPKQADCIKLTFEGKGTYMLIAPLELLRDWVEALREQWKGGSHSRATEEFLRDSDAMYIAHCSFQAQTKEQVSVVAGEQVSVVDFGPSWYTVTTAAGDTGLVPSTVVAYKDSTEPEFC